MTGAPAAGNAGATARYAYLGPEGSFTDEALRSYLAGATAPQDRTVERIAHESVPTALDAVRRGEVDAAMVAFESSVEGAVAVTLDELASGSPLVILGEVVLPVSFSLLVRPGTDRAAVRDVAGHPHAFPQYRRWFEQNLPDAVWHASASNSQAAREVADGRHDAAFAPRAAADIYGLEVLAQDIHDVEGAETRFVLVSRPGPVSAPTGADKTSLVLYMRADHSGALLEILTELAVRGINLTRIESRPTRVGLGSYCFSVDAEGHVLDARVGEALMGLHRVCRDVRFLGSYPRADGRSPLLRTGVSDAEFTDARAWLDRVRAGGT